MATERRTCYNIPSATFRGTLLSLGGLVFSELSSSFSVFFFLWIEALRAVAQKKKTRVAISRNALRRTHIAPTAPCTFYVRNRRVTASSAPASVAAGCGIKEAPSCRSFRSGRFTRSVFAGLGAVSCGSPTCDHGDRFFDLGYLSRAPAYVNL